MLARKDILLLPIQRCREGRALKRRPGASETAPHRPCSSNTGSENRPPGRRAAAQRIAQVLARCYRRHARQTLRRCDSTETRYRAEATKQGDEKEGRERGMEAALLYRDYGAEREAGLD